MMLFRWRRFSISGAATITARACLQSERGYEDVDGVYHRGEAGVGFFVAGGDAAKRLYPAKEILDQMAPFIFLSVVAVGACGSLSRRDDRLGAVMREELSHLVGVESFVAEKRAASDAVHELVEEIGRRDAGREPRRRR